MKDSVRAAFVRYSKDFESCLSFPYLDVKRLATVGIGDLEEPLSAFQTLPWTRGVGGPKCSVPEIQAAYWSLKHSTLNPLAGGMQYENVTQLRLSDDDIMRIVMQKVSQNETILMSLLPEWLTFPADAQLGFHSMDWALGAYFPKTWPRFTAAARAGDWNTCAHECQPSPAEMVRQNKSFRSRVSSWITLFSNAAVVVAQEIDPNVLQFPNVMAA